MTGNPSRQRRRTVASVCFVLSFAVTSLVTAEGTVPQDAAETDAQDEVVLRDGTIVRGVVHERPGPRIEIRIHGGAKLLDRASIESVRFDDSRESNQVATQDGVVRIDGHRIDGTVQLFSGGQVVRVQIPGGSSVTLPRSQVLKIIKKGDRLGVGGRVYSREVGESIRTAVARTRSATGQSEVLQRDERFLMECGIFAIDQVRAALVAAESESPAHASLARVDRLYRLKERLSPEIVTYDKDAAVILAAGSTAEKENLLLFLLARHVDSSVPLARFLATDEAEVPLIRAYAIDFLRRMQRNRDLIAIYGSSTGKTQLASAIALGKNQILIGVPALIDALELPNQEVRALAATYLRSFTSESFRFRSDGAPEARRHAVVRWRDWWIANEKNATELARRVLEQGQLETPERRRARQLWQRAEAARASGNSLLARKLLDEALNSDPVYFRAQLAMAVLLLVDLGKPELARDMLARMAAEKRPDLTPENRYWIHFYLGSGCATLGDQEGALAAYQECALSDPTRIDGTVRLARTAFGVATGSQELSQERRRELLGVALENYERAAKLGDSASQELVTFSVADLPADDAIHFERRKHNRAVLEFRRRYRRERFEYLLEVAKIQTLLGEKDTAVQTLEKGIEEIGGFHGIVDLRTIEVKMRNLLGMMYDDAGRDAEALRQYSYIQKHLDSEDEHSRLAIEQARRKSRSAPGN